MKLVINTMTFFLCRIPIPKIIPAWQEETGRRSFPHEEAISETARLTDEKAALGEDVMERLDWIFMQIKAKMSENPEVTITYFLPDEKKAGGRYESYAGVVKKMDEYKRELVFNDHTVIPMHQIVNIEADWLERSSNEDITCD